MAAYNIQIDHPAIQRMRDLSPNIEVFDNAGWTQNACVIYFSSNALYYPNTEEAIEAALVRDNRFEWMHNRDVTVRREIFVRDVYKQWYLGGISSAVDSIERLRDVLRASIDSSMRVTCLGSSAGGYAAALMGTMLGADLILVFNAQFSLRPLLQCADCSERNPLIWRNRSNPAITHYLDLKPVLMAREKPLYYFYSCRSAQDLEQQAHVSSVPCVREVAFRTANHGIPFLRPALNGVLALNGAQLEALSGRTYNPIAFSLKHGGLIPCLKFLARKGLSRRSADAARGAGEARGRQEGARREHVTGE
jgi:hypothetical protein